MPRYMFLFVDDETWRERSSKEEVERGYAAVRAWWEELSEKGVIKGGDPLQPSRTATTVKRVNGKMQVTDGPFLEAKEQVGGYALIEVADLDAAIAAARSWPAGDVEIRPTVEH